MNCKNENLEKLREKYNYPFTYEPFKHQDIALDKSCFEKNYALFMEMGCVDGHTEYLSETGWKKFKDFDINNPEKVAQYHPETKQLSFVLPTAFIDQPCEDFLHFKNTTMDMMLSEEHIVPVRKRITNGSDYPTHVTALELYQHNIRCKTGIKTTYGFPQRFFYDGERDTNLNLDEYQLRLQVAVIADGHFPNKEDTKCVINLRKNRKIDRLRWLFKKCGVFYLEKDRRFNDRPYKEFTFQAPMRVKHFDNRFWMVNLAQKKVICDECVRWDGSIVTENGVFVSSMYYEPTKVNDRTMNANMYKDFFFYSVNKQSADFIQWCFASLGFDTSINTKTSALYTEGKYYTVKINDKNRMQKDYRTIITNEQIKPVKIKNGRKYCFKVPTEHLLIRRNDEMIITGNSGKTKVLLDTAGMLYRDGEIDSVVIIAPKGVYSNWVNSEIPAHMPPEIETNIIHWISDAGAKHKKLVQYYSQNPTDKLDIFVINIESLQYAGGYQLEDFIQAHKKTLMIIDESTCIKNHEAKRTKKAIALGKMPSVKYKRIATGSPVTNSPLDLYSQCGFLDKSLLGFGSFYAFRGTYTVLEPVTISGGAQIMKPVGVKNLHQLTQKLAGFSFRVQKKDCLDLPDKVYTTREVTMTKEQKEAYNMMVREAIAYFDENKMTANIAITKMMRLHQIVCGSFKDDYGQTHRLPNNRLEVLSEVLEETDGKVIIFANYRNDIAVITKMLKETYGEKSVVNYFGDTTTEERMHAVEQFDRKFTGYKDPAIRFFVGNTQTAGYGITLTEASHVIYYSNDYSLERRLQSEDRAHRAGQINKVTYTDILCKGTVDEKIIKALLDKKSMADTILQDGVSEWLKVL